jgi:ABC-type Mn2+/Zn2+ transport system ATPase subunit
MARKRAKPRCIIIAGPNGSGKTTFARDYLPGIAGLKPPKRKESFAAGVGRGLRKAARTARKVARMYGTPIYVWENGKVVAKDPNDKGW